MSPRQVWTYRALAALFALVAIAALWRLVILAQRGTFC